MFVKCRRKLLKVNSEGLYPSSKMEVKFCRCWFMKCKIRHFHVAVVQKRQRNVQKSLPHVQNCCFAYFTYSFFYTLSLLSRRWILKSVMTSNQFPSCKKDSQLHYLYYYFKSFKSSLPCKRFLHWGLNVCYSESTDIAISDQQGRVHRFTSGTCCITCPTLLHSGCDDGTGYHAKGSSET